MVKTSLPNAGGASSIPGQGAEIPHAAQETKTQSRSHIVTNSVKTLKKVHIKKNLKKKKKPVTLSDSIPSSLNLKSKHDISHLRWRLSQLTGQESTERVHMIFFRPDIPSAFNKWFGMPV